MIIKTEKFQESCKKILSAVDTDAETKNVVYGYDTLEIDVAQGKAHLNVTNGEYYVSVVLDAPENETFRAVVDAKLFLTLISKVTTSEIEIGIAGNSLEVKANGTYKFKLKFLGEDMLTLPKLVIDEPTTEFVIAKDKLLSMLNFNGKEFGNGTISRPIQKLYYLDQEGCITWTNSSACINSFSLSTPICVLLPQKVVKLFKLFKNDDVKFTLGHTVIGGIVQTRVKFENDDVIVYSTVSSDETLLNSVPKEAIRGRANKQFPYDAPLLAKELSDAIDRLMLFSGNNAIAKDICIFEFTQDELRIYDSRKENVETLNYYQKQLPEGTHFVINLGVIGIKNVLDNSDEQFVDMNFGDEQIVVLANGSIKNVISKRMLS